MKAGKGRSQWMGWEKRGHEADGEVMGIEVDDGR